MKKLLGTFALTAVAAACQPQASQQIAVADTPPTVVPTAYHEKTAPATATTPTVSLAPAQLALLRRYNLGPLLQSLQTGGESSIQVQNGFFGPAGYRIEMALVKMVRDPARPNVFRVGGKSRYKKVITPFNGTVTIVRLLDQPKYTAREVAEGSQNQPGMYTAVGSYELREDASQRGAGVFRGRVFLDFHVTTEGTVEQLQQTMHTLAQGGGVKYKGTWTNTTTGRTQPVVWVEDIFSYQGPQVFKDFTVGERDVDFNPKYARLGWNTYWQNDEWWTDSPKHKNRTLRTVLFIPPVIPPADSAGLAAK